MGGRIHVTTCSNPKCKGKSQIEQTVHQGLWYVRRTRACVKCGQTWSTAEIPLQMAQRALDVEHLIRKFTRV